MLWQDQKNVGKTTTDWQQANLIGLSVLSTRPIETFDRVRLNSVLNTLELFSSEKSYISGIAPFFLLAGEDAA